MTPSTKLMIAADRLANRPCSDTERATANLLKLISERLHERGFYPEPELKAALALADAVENEHGPEASATQPMPPSGRSESVRDCCETGRRIRLAEQRCDAQANSDRDDWENDFSNCPRCGQPRANSWTDHCVPCDGPQKVVSGGPVA